MTSGYSRTACNWMKLYIPVLMVQNVTAMRNLTRIERQEQEFQMALNLSLQEHQKQERNEDHILDQVKKLSEAEYEKKQKEYLRLEELQDKVLVKMNLKEVVVDAYGNCFFLSLIHQIEHFHLTQYVSQKMGLGTKQLSHENLRYFLVGAILRKYERLLSNFQTTGKLPLDDWEIVLLGDTTNKGIEEKQEELFTMLQVGKHNFNAFDLLPELFYKIFNIQLNLIQGDRTYLPANITKPKATFVLTLKEGHYNSTIKMKAHEILGVSLREYNESLAREVSLNEEKEQTAEYLRKDLKFSPEEMRNVRL